MNISFTAELRKFVENVLGASPRSMRMTGVESLAVANVEPSGFELARAGRRFHGGIQNGATGRAPVGTIPTTAAAWILHNGESDGGASLVLDRATVVQISGTAAVGGVILAALTTTKITAPTAATGYSTSSSSKSGRTSKATWGDNITLGAAPVWTALRGNGNPANSTNGGDTADIQGRIIVPPGYAVAFHYLSGAGTTPLFGISAEWAEIKTELE